MSGRRTTLLRALVGAGIRCLSHKTCQQDRYENKVEGNLQGDQIGSMARRVGRVPDGPEYLLGRTADPPWRQRRSCYR